MPSSTERPKALHTLEIATTNLEQLTPEELSNHLEDIKEVRRRIQALEIHTKYVRRRRPDPNNEGHLVEEYVPR